MKYPDAACKCEVYKRAYYTEYYHHDDHDVLGLILLSYLTELP